MKRLVLAVVLLLAASPLVSQRRHIDVIPSAESYEDGVTECDPSRDYKTIVKESTTSWYCDESVDPSVWRKLVTSLNVESITDYGATGGADDTVSIQNSINALEGSGRTLWLPEGTWKISSPLTTTGSLRVEGSAGQGSILQATGSFSGSMFTTAGTVESDIRIENLKFDGAGLASSGINLDADTDVIIGSVSIDNTLHQGLYLKGAGSGAVVRDVVITKTVQGSSLTDHEGGLQVEWSWVVVDNVTVDCDRTGASSESGEQVAVIYRAVSGTMTGNRAVSISGRNCETGAVFETDGGSFAIGGVSFGDLLLTDIRRNGVELRDGVGTLRGVTLNSPTVDDAGLDGPDHTWACYRNMSGAGIGNAINPKCRWDVANPQYECAYDAGASGYWNLFGKVGGLGSGTESLNYCQPGPDTFNGVNIMGMNHETRLALQGRQFLVGREHEADTAIQFVFKSRHVCVGGTQPGTHCDSDVDCSGGGTCPHADSLFTWYPVDGYHSQGKFSFGSEIDTTAGLGEGGTFASCADRGPGHHFLKDAASGEGQELYVCLYQDDGTTLTATFLGSGSKAVVGDVKKTRTDEVGDLTAQEITISSLLTILGYIESDVTDSDYDAFSFDAVQAVHTGPIMSLYDEGALRVSVTEDADVELLDQSTDCSDPATGMTSLCTRGGVPCYRDTGGLTICEGESRVDTDTFVRVRFPGGDTTGYSGTHTGTDDSPSLIDSGANFPVFGVLIGSRVDNFSDGSFCVITSHTATVVVCSLTGGVENLWDSGDSYKIIYTALGMTMGGRDEGFPSLLKSFDILNDQNSPYPGPSLGTILGSTRKIYLQVNPLSESVQFLEKFTLGAGLGESGYDSPVVFNDVIRSAVRTLTNEPTPDVDSGNFFKTGGTTTITDFDNSVPGQEICVLAQHTVTVTHNASNIYLKGLADWTMNSGDMLCLSTEDSVVWYERGRGHNTPPTDGVVRTLNSASSGIQSRTEEITLNTGGTTTDSVGTLLPENSLILGVTARVTTSITVATDWSLGDSVRSDRFTSPNTTTAAGGTDVGHNHWDPTVSTADRGPVQVSNAALRITTTGTPGAGVVRVTVFYSQTIPPGS